MIQIRQKKQNLRNQRRKQFLENHFKTLRKRHFNFDHSSEQKNQLNGGQLQQLIQESMGFNSLLLKIREGNLLNKLSLITSESIQKNNKQQAKYLLIIFSNTFKDDMNPYEKEELFKISIKLFESLKITHVKFGEYEERKQFKQTLQILSSQALSYFIFNIIFQSQFLEQEDQSTIEKIIYPALVNVLFYSIKHPQLIGSISNFCNDIQRLIFSIFDHKQQDYETGNLQKVRRNQKIFIDIMMNHYFYIDSNQIFSEDFIKIQATLFWLYNKLTDHFDSIQSLFQKKEFWLLIEQAFRNQIGKKHSNIIIHLYSILRTLVDNGLFVNETECMMLERDHQVHSSTLDKIIAIIQNGSDQLFEALQFLEGKLISNQDKNNFEKIIELNGIRLMEMLITIILRTERQTLSKIPNRRILKKTLTMVFMLIEKGNKQIHEKQNQFCICFEKLEGIKKIQQIASWFNEIDQNEDSDIAETCELIGWILLQGIQFSAQISDTI